MSALNTSNVVATKVNSDNCILVSYQASYITENRTIDFKKLGIDITGLPKKTKKKLQSEIFNGDIFKKYKAKETEMKNFVSEHGAKCPGGFLIAPAFCNEFVRLAKDVTDCFESYKNADYQSWDALCDQAINEHKMDKDFMGFEHRDTILEAIRSKQPTKDEFMMKVGFTFYFQSLVLSGEFDEVAYQAYAENQTAMMEGAVGGLILEVARMCDEKYQYYTAPARKEKCINFRTVKAFIPLIDKKLKELEFISPVIVNLRDQLMELFKPYVEVGEALRDQEKANFLTLLDGLRNQIHIHNALNKGKPLFVVHDCLETETASKEDGSDVDLFMGGSNESSLDDETSDGTEVTDPDCNSIAEETSQLNSFDHVEENEFAAALNQEEPSPLTQWEELQEEDVSAHFQNEEVIQHLEEPDIEKEQIVPSQEGVVQDANVVMTNDAQYQAMLSDFGF